MIKQKTVNVSVFHLLRSTHASKINIVQESKKISRDTRENGHYLNLSAFVMLWQTLDCFWQRAVDWAISS